MAPKMGFPPLGSRGPKYDFYLKIFNILQVALYHGIMHKFIFAIAFRFCNNSVASRSIKNPFSNDTWQYKYIYMYEDGRMVIKV